MGESNNQVFKTSDTPLAAFLITEGHPLLDAIDDNGRTFWLFANDDPQFQSLIKDFQLLQATTNAAQIIFNYQKLVKRSRRGY